MDMNDKTQIVTRYMVKSECSRILESPAIPVINNHLYDVITYNYNVSDVETIKATFCTTFQSIINGYQEKEAL